MSRIKQEVDRALEQYGDQATVFLVVRRALRGWERSLHRPLIAEEIDQPMIAVVVVIRWVLSRRRKYIRHIRRLLPVDRPVTTERLKKAMEDS